MLRQINATMAIHLKLSDWNRSQGDHCHGDRASSCPSVPVGELIEVNATVGRSTQ